MSKTGVFIWGSCVSRDTFEHIDPATHQLVHYVARQSAVSAATPAVQLIKHPALESKFQQRMVTGDFASNLERELTRHADRIDLIMIDLVDERLGFYVLPDDSVVTRSVELIRAGGEEMLPVGSRHVAFGELEHYQRWQRSITWTSDLIQRLLPDAEVVLLDIPWAASSSSGEPTPASFGINARKGNRLFRRYAKFAEKALGARAIRIPASQVSSGPTHPWGVAPFHYTEDVYLRIVKQLTGAASGRAAWGPPNCRAQIRRGGVGRGHEPGCAR
ncbi:DUF6270 domain-containing protein [Ornithinicoccus hortensis]|uniref:Uncharacterized protein n=1 Tax=Ornithinicoccus hortensis TaxID=82346 RepID=A0A542YLI7_9MICO|nr:DUF6270 domain-containing protein [Ornithinicoccus hortensis]TQL48960.1 hypothetical protein FB467_0022 [Ornithinicoccus hortensis]